MTSRTSTSPLPLPSMHWGALAVLAASTFATAAVGAYASINAKTFYAALNQPAWAPPPTVFGPVWSVLYVMMCVAAWSTCRQLGLPRAWPAMRLYGAQLALNAVWTWLFFHFHQGAAALAEILLLLGMVALTARRFGSARPLAGAMMLPYLAWVGFASMLTFALWRLNPGVL